MVYVPQRRSEPAAAAADRDERREHPSFPARSSPSSFGRVPFIAKTDRRRRNVSTLWCTGRMFHLPGTGILEEASVEVSGRWAILKGRLRERENDATPR